LFTLNHLFEFREGLKFLRFEIIIIILRLFYIAPFSNPRSLYIVGRQVNTTATTKAIQQRQVM